MTSIRAKIAATKISENIRNPDSFKRLSIGKILLESGYSKQTSLKPKLVTESKVFKNELSKLIPDEELVKANIELLHAKKLCQFQFPLGMTDRDMSKIIEGLPGRKIKEISRKKNGSAICFYWSPDGSVIDKALDLLYRVKGYYNLNRRGTPQKITVQTINYKTLK